MINSNLTNAMMIQGAAPAPTKSAQAPARGDNAFEEALAGAHTVRDQREGRPAAASTQRDAQATRSTDRSRTTAETKETERSASQDGDAKTVSTKTDAQRAEGTEAAASQTDAAPTEEAAAAAASDAAEAAAALVAGDDQAAAAAIADAQASVVVSAAPVVTVETVAAPAATETAGAVTSDAVDAAFRLAIDTPSAATETDTPTEATVAATTATTAGIETSEAADAAPKLVATTQAATTTAATDIDTDADAAAVADTADPVTTTTLASTQVSEGVDDADAQVGPTRPAASTNAPITAGPSTATDAAPVAVDQQAAPTTKVAAPVQQVEVEAAAATTTTTTAQAAAAAPAVDVAEGDVAAAANVVAAAATAATAETETGDDAAKAAVADTVATDAAVDGADVPVAKAASGTPAGTTGSQDDAAGQEGATADAADAILQPTRPAVTPQQPAIAAQLETAVQASQARAAEKATIAEEGASSSTTTKPLDPLSNLGQNLSAALRPEHAAGANRVRETMADPDLQTRIDTIADQLAARLKLSQAAGGSQVQLNLKPRELGDVTVKMEVREGVVAASIMVDRADSMRTIETNIAELKRSLESQGLVVQEFTVDVRGENGAAAGGFDQRSGSNANPNANGAASLAGAAGVIPGLSSDREVDADEIHDGDVSVLV